MKTEGYDICSVCSTSQSYGSMKDINEVSFDLVCKRCEKGNTTSRVGTYIHNQLEKITEEV